MGNVLVIAQIQDGELKKATHSVCTFAAQAAAHIGSSYSILALGDDLSGQRDSLSALGADKVYLAQEQGLNNAVAERWAPIIEKVVRDNGVKIVVGCASSTNKDVLPRLAARLGAGMASDVIDLGTGDGKLTYTRPMYAGNVNGTVEIDTEIEVLTVRATEFDHIEQAGSSPVENVDLPAAEDVLSKIEFVGFEKAESARPDLAEASVVATGGRGVKAKENFKLVEDLADLLGGAVGATRAAVDSGFIHNDFQVGQTGKIVAPDLYFAIGLSGALQHVAGMKSSKVVVAINKDEEAPIFQIADYGIVGDLFKVVPELIEEIKKVAR